MTKRDKARRIGVQLDELFPLPAPPLGQLDPFRLLVAVVLSAQTTDAKVNAVAPALFARAATPQSMARVPQRTLERLLAPIGLAPTKARYLRALSRELLARHGGEVPDDFAALEALTGVGHKTASVVMAQAFGRPAFPVDTHIHRLARRWGLSDGSRVERTEADLKALFPPAEWHRRHLQIIFFGRRYCPARGHDPAACPICSWAAVRRSHERASRDRSRTRTQSGPSRPGVGRGNRPAVRRARPARIPR